MTDDMGFDLKLPDVGELTFPQWRDWLVRYNAFIGERDVRYAAGLRERDDRIEKLETALRLYACESTCPNCYGQVQDTRYCGWTARKALEGKDDVD